MIEVVKPSGGLFPNPLEEGISFDIYSTFIEPPPTMDTEMKVCFLFIQPISAWDFLRVWGKEANVLPFFSLCDFTQLKINICFTIDLKVASWGWFRNFNLFHSIIFPSFHLHFLKVSTVSIMTWSVMMLINNENAGWCQIAISWQIDVTPGSKWPDIWGSI